MPSGNPSCAVRSPAEIDVGIDPSDCTVTRMNFLAKFVGSAFVDQVDGATTEAAARHAGSIATGKTGGNLDQRIQLAAAGLEIIAEAAVCLGHQSPEGQQIPTLERRCG